MRVLLGRRSGTQQHLSELAGLELVIGSHDGKRILTLNDAQHAYRFDEVL